MEITYQRVETADGGQVHDAVGYAMLRHDWLAGTTTPPEWHDEYIRTGVTPTTAEPDRKSGAR